jgi:hypothetical protein
VYKAVVTLTAKTGYTFTGVTANSFTHSGATSVTNAANSGTVTVTFPATDTVVNATVLTGLVTAPVKGATPDTTPINETQYAGTIAWRTAAETPHSGAFAGGTVYKAVVTLIVKTGYTFNGVVANSFTYSGATMITNTANSGTVTITFPATEAEGGTDPDDEPNVEIPIGNPSIKLYLDGGTIPLTHNGSTTITAESGIFTVSIASDPYSEIIWHLNGNLQTQAQGKTSIVLSKQTAVTYLVTVEATPQGGEKNSGAHTFVVQ